MTAVSIINNFFYGFWYVFGNAVLGLEAFAIVFTIFLVLWYFLIKR